jgi:Growth inhibitor
MEVHRGEVFYADLSPVVGSEQGGVRPVLIVQNEIGNRHIPTVIAACRLHPGWTYSRLPTHIYFRGSGHRACPGYGVVLLEQILRGWTYTGCWNEPVLSAPATRAGWIWPWTSSWGLPPSDSQAPAARCGRGFATRQVYTGRRLSV